MEFDDYFSLKILIWNLVKQKIDYYAYNWWRIIIMIISIAAAAAANILIQSASLWASWVRGMLRHDVCMQAAERASEHTIIWEHAIAAIYFMKAAFIRLDGRASAQPP